MNELIPIINIGSANEILLGYKCLCEQLNRYYLQDGAGRTAICNACHRMFNPYSDSSAALINFK